MLLTKVIGVGFLEMGIEVIEDKLNGARLRIGSHDIADQQRELVAGAIWGCPCKVSSCFRFNGSENIAITLVLVVPADAMAGRAAE